MAYIMVKDQVAGRFLIAFVDPATGNASVKAETPSQTDALTIVGVLNAGQ